MSCKTIIGGLKNLYILGQFDKDLSADSTIANGVMTASSASNDVFQFELVSDSNTFNEENEVSRDNGTSLFNQTGTFVLKKQGASTQALLMKLSKVRTQVILEDHMGNFRLAGLEYGVDFTVGTTSGGAMADLNGYNLTFTGKELALATYIDESLIGSSLPFNLDSTNVDPS
tara:strand:- start:790 stop:1305 length:516 start_codon:yes stop_codon:yes gene_type:complete